MILDKMEGCVHVCGCINIWDPLYAHSGVSSWKPERHPLICLLV